MGIEGGFLSSRLRRKIRSGAIRRPTSWTLSPATFKRRKGQLGRYQVGAEFQGLQIGGARLRKPIHILLELSELQVGLSRGMSRGGLGKVADAFPSSS